MKKWHHSMDLDMEGCLIQNAAGGPFGHTQGMLFQHPARDGLKVEQVVFISAEDTGTDLILSFALGTGGDDIRSLILMRTPRYEPLLEESERGVTISLQGEFDEEPIMLRALRVLNKSGDN